jgi:cytochrome c oxidase cbb3-type subunit 2
VPADLTSGQFKSGPAVEDIYRTMTTGLSGTPMPSYRDSLPDEDRWALSYYVLALSAYKDPLTKQPLAIADKDRAALNDPSLKADTPENAYVPGEGPQQKAAALGTSAPTATKGE